MYIVYSQHGQSFNPISSYLKVTFAESFAPLNIKSLEETSLTLMHTGSTVNPRELIKVEPMEIKTYKISFM